MKMGRLLTLVLIVTFVLTNGSAVAAAVCRHMDAGAHAIALRSHDNGISAPAQTEEAAGSVASKKGAPVDGGSAQLAAYTLSPLIVAWPPRVEEPNRRRASNSARLKSASVRPLLEPPAV